MAARSKPKPALDFPPSAAAAFDADAEDSWRWHEVCAAPAVALTAFSATLAAAAVCRKFLQQQRRKPST